MVKEQITDKEGLCLLMIYVMGSTLLIGTGGEAKNDAWIAGILAIVLSIPMLLIYSKLLTLFPGKDLYEILEITFGKIVGKIVSLLYIWYSFHLGALVIRNFGEFVNNVTMPETPMFVPILSLAIVGVIAVKSGIEVIARISAYSLQFLIITIIAVQLMGLPSENFRNIKPILGNGFTPVLKGAFAAFSFPFAETVLFIGVFSALKNNKSIKKVFVSGVVFAGIIIVILGIRNILILDGLSDRLYFPANVAVARIKVGDFIERIEVTVSIVFIFGVFIKSSVCIFVASKGIARFFNLKDYRTIVLQTGILMGYFAYIVYDNIMDMVYWAFKVYAYYAFPFQVIIPIITLIIAEIKVRYMNKKAAGNS